MSKASTQYGAAVVTAETIVGLEQGVEQFLEALEQPWELRAVSHSAHVEPAGDGGSAKVVYSALLVTGRPRGS